MWVKAVDLKQFDDTVYIDFSKAFDTVRHPKLIYKLPKYGICGNIIQRFTSFLSNRKQRVKIGETCSGDTDVSSDVPQGSCTGPLLFILYVNDLPDERLTANTSVCLFADDTKISSVFSDVSERPDMQECLKKFVVWADRRQLQAAEHKCCVLTIGNIIPTTYHLKRVQLLHVNEYLDLGVIVDDKCLFKQHISSICRKAYITINVIVRCFLTANIDVHIKTHKSFVRQVLEYFSTVVEINVFIYLTSLHTMHYLGITDQLENMQRLFTRWVYYRCQLDTNHGYIQRLEYLKLESLELLRIYNDLVIVYNILHGYVNV